MFRLLTILLLCYGCYHSEYYPAEDTLNRQFSDRDTIEQSVTIKTYSQLKAEIIVKRKEFAIHYDTISNEEKENLFSTISNYWIDMIGAELYRQWKLTPWDFNGTTKEPGKGTIACGYFVTTLLQDMDYRLNRIKLSTCTSMAMMKALTPKQKVKNLSYLSYEKFNQAIRDAGKGVFIIGLDYHTGFLINDGFETWFLHSNYINRQGVIKEKISSSSALKASQSRFVISLTGDKPFILKWLKYKPGN